VPLCLQPLDSNPGKHGVSIRTGRSFTALLGTLESIHGAQNTEDADDIPLLDANDEIYIEVSGLNSIHLHSEPWSKVYPSGGPSVLGETDETATNQPTVE
jgi:hypothetical protein